MKDKYLMTLIIAAFIILFILAVMLGKVNAHDTHFSDLTLSSGTIVDSGWVKDYGYTFAVDEDGDGTADVFYLVYKDGDLGHQGLHVISLTEEETKIVNLRFTIKKEMFNRMKGGSDEEIK